MASRLVPDPKPKKDLSSRVTALSEFSVDLYEYLAKLKGGNLFFSPVSVFTVFGMLYAGARQTTATQLESVFKFGSLGMSTHRTFGELLLKLKEGASRYQLKTANGVYVDKKYNLLDNYLDLVTSSYNSTVTVVDFSSATEAARQTINAWVEEVTARRIKNLVVPGVLSKETAMVLVNAVYFKGDWERKFECSATSQKPFHVTEERDVLIRMMHQKAKFSYGFLAELDCKILEIPYVSHDLSMIILLPEEVCGLPKVEGQLTAALLRSVSTSWVVKTVDVFLPKFRLEQSFELSQVLAGMGMPDIFCEHKSDLSGVDGTRSLFVSNVIHKSFVEVNEEGTEAAAATAVTVIRKRRAVVNTIPTFVADHPFLFCIRHNATGTLLFLGRLSEP